MKKVDEKVELYALLNYYISTANINKISEIAQILIDKYDDADALVALGITYVNRDDQQALKLFEQGHIHGSKKALNYLYQQSCHANCQEYAIKAAKYLNKNKSTLANIWMGYAYLHLKPKNEALGIKYLLKASQDKVSDKKGLAFEYLAEYYLKNKKYKEACSCSKKGLVVNDSKFLHSCLGTLYLDGLGVKKNIEEAINHFILGSDAYSYGKLADIYLDYLSIKNKYEIAFLYATKAIKGQNFATYLTLYKLFNDKASPYFDEQKASKAYENYVAAGRDNPAIREQIEKQMQSPNGIDSLTQSLIDKYWRDKNHEA